MTAANLKAWCTTVILGAAFLNKKKSPLAWGKYTQTHNKGRFSGGLKWVPARAFCCSCDKQNKFRNFSPQASIYDPFLMIFPVASSPNFDGNTFGVVVQQASGKSQIMNSLQALGKDPSLIASPKSSLQGWWPGSLWARESRYQTQLGFKGAALPQPKPQGAGNAVLQLWGWDPASCLCLRFNHQTCQSSHTLLFSPCAHPTCCLISFMAPGPNQLCFCAANNQMAFMLPEREKTATERERISSDCFFSNNEELYLYHGEVHCCTKAVPFPSCQSLSSNDSLAVACRIFFFFFLPEVA